MVEQIRRLASDPDLAEQVFAEATKQQKVQKRRLKAEQKRLQRERQQKGEEIKRMVTAIAGSKEPLASLTNSLGELESAIGRIDKRLAEIQRELASGGHKTVDKDDLAAALSLFDPVWDELYPVEKSRVINLLIKRVEYDAGIGQVQIVPGLHALDY